MMPSYVLALDQGTSSSRAILFDRQGQPVAQSQRPHRQDFPHPGWVEHDPIEIWRNQLAVARETMVQGDVRACEIAAIGIANQRETVVLWERATGFPVGPAIVWQDRRTASWCEALAAAGHEAMVTQKTGLLLDAYFSATKLSWLLDNVPNGRARAERGELAFGTIDSWLIWNLTGGRQHVTDASNASRTLLFNIHTERWDDELLALFRIPPTLLPAIVPSSSICGQTSGELFDAPIALAGIAGDQQAAAFGQACLQPGMAKATYGTGCFTLLNTGTHVVQSKRGLLATIGWRFGDSTVYALEGSSFMAGALFSWLRDQLGLVSSLDEIEPLASSCASTDGVMIVPAFTGLGAPHWDATARGTILGLTRGSGRAHIARAALEAVALQTAELLMTMEDDSGIRLTELRVDGGAARNDLLMQMQADLLGMPVLRPALTETTALGAAYLAGLAVGWWSNPQALVHQWHPERRFDPVIADDQRTERLAQWRRAVERARNWQQNPA